MIWIPANFFILIQTAKPEVISLKSQKSVSTKLRQNSFPVRVENDWNKLPHTVVNAPSVNSFKYRLEEY